tara:strand:- start:513 stop:1091 length:579 start_codon:yes stop_codon:yes gene_type:complete
MKKTTLAGIDYSLNSPAICISNGSMNFNDCNFHFLTDKKKWQCKISKNIFGYAHKQWTDPIERFNNLASWSHKCLKENGDINLYDGKSTKVFIEGYSYGSKGQAIFQIAENGGILKSFLRAKKIKYDIIVPSVVKKCATEKGNANKDLMYECFTNETKTNLKEIFEVERIGNPISDIVDSYYIMKCGYLSSK